MAIRWKQRRNDNVNPNSTARCTLKRVFFLPLYNLRWILDWFYARLRWCLWRCWLYRLIKKCCARICKVDPAFEDRGNFHVCRSFFFDSATENVFESLVHHFWITLYTVCYINTRSGNERKAIFNIERCLFNAPYFQSTRHSVYNCYKDASTTRHGWILVCCFKN